MKKTFSKKYWIISISACCISAGIALACAGDWGPEYGTSNFTPEIIVADSTYSPFFFSNQFYYGINHDDNHDRRFNTTNTREWSGYFGKNIPSEELDFLLQKATSGAIDSAAAWVAFPTGKLPASMQGFRLIQNRKDPKLAAFLRYLQIAKQGEIYALNNVTGSWDYEEKKKDKPTILPAAFDEIIPQKMKSADPFLKERYYFQWVRFYFFYDSPQKTIGLFEQHEKEFSHGSIYYRTMAYAAGAYYKLKNYSKANYLYSRVYEGCPELRTVAHYSFHPQEEKDWTATLALCRNNGEKATLWQMLGIFYSDEQRSLEEIYELDPKSEKMDLLMVRAVNIYEQKFNSGSANEGYSVKPASDSSDKALLTLVTRIAEEGKTTRPWTWDMAAGYLNTLEGKYTTALSWYARTTSLLPKDNLAQSQLRLLKLINKASMTRQIDTRTENELLPDIEWLRAMNSQQTNGQQTANPQGSFRSSDAFEWLRKKIAALYKKQKDPIKAECFVTGSDFYANDQRVAALKTFLEKTGKTPYEDLCSRLSSIKKEDVSEYQAIKSAYEGHPEVAVEKLANNPGAATELPGNPFNGRIQDCHDCDFSAPQKIKYTKLSFLQKMKDIKDKIAAGTDVYTNAVLLGNAYYNMSQYGNARTFYECKIIGSGHSDASYIDSAFRQLLTGMKISAGYYTQALNAASNDEQKAKCQYMLAKCERNEWYNFTPSADGHGPDFLDWKGFATLRSYSSTQYYKDVIRECGYFKTYIRKRASSAGKK